MTSRQSEIAFHVPLGRVDYVRALEIQRRVHTQRVEERLPDVLITVEHEPVFTRGRSARPVKYLVSAEDVDRAAIPVVDVERGGDMTYHGPGQLVAYPIVDLRSHGRDVKRYVATLEDAAIGTLREFGIAADRRRGFPGVWVREGKIASIGIYVKNWVTRHGLALNVDVNPAHFGMIDPCGLPVRAVSMSECLARPIAVVEVERALAGNLARRFGWRLQRRTLADLEERVCV
ncbi:MAG: lipoyl(octanoyl) transferase LipB [Candidatus Bipolaricaulis sp.]|nr:lipoyl(octanoyl) transferase LipB [Candidatus Bipolaricaulis sp.]